MIRFLAHLSFPTGGIRGGGALSLMPDVDFTGKNWLLQREPGQSVQSFGEDLLTVPPMSKVQGTGSSLWW